MSGRDSTKFPDNNVYRNLHGATSQQGAVSITCQDVYRGRLKACFCWKASTIHSFMLPKSIVQHQCSSLLHYTLHLLSVFIHFALESLTPTTHLLMVPSRVLSRFCLTGSASVRMSVSAIYKYNVKEMK